MNAEFTPWDGQGGHICLPLVKNISEPREGWKKVECPKCGAECYLSPEAKQIVEENQGKITAYCTECVLRMSQKGAGHEHESD